jgi:hypothetical protein
MIQVIILKSSHQKKKNNKTQFLINPMSKVEIKKHINFTKDPNTKSSNKKIRIKFDKKKIL